MAKERKLVPEGKYLTKPQSWGSGLNKNGKPFAWVKFANGAFYQGYFVDGAIEYTVKSLYIAGFRGKTSQDLNNDKALNKNKEVEIVVEHEDYEGKTYSKVAWINDPNKRKVLDPADVKTLQGIDLRAYVSDLNNENPDSLNAKDVKNVQDSMKSNQNVDSNFTAEDIPF